MDAPFIKVITTDGYDFGEPTAKLVKSSAAGLRGNDLRDFIKRAGHQFADHFQRVCEQLKPGDVPVHLIALGATEFFGPNRNGDGFKVAACRKYHDTFVKFARWYRNHCFPAGTLVVRGDRLRVPIEQLVVGDAVATREGPKKITRVMREDYKGPAVTIKTAGSVDKLVSTPEHPVFVLRREEVHCYRDYCCFTKGEHQRVCRSCRKLREELAPKYVKTGSVRVGDYLMISRPEPGVESVSPEFAELVGWVASEGYLSKDGYTIHFTFSSKNEADLSAVSKCLLANGVPNVAISVRAGGLTQLTGSKKDLVARLSRYVTGIKNHKRLTSAVLSWDRESLLRLLGSYVSGDGHVAKGRNAGQLRIRSSSPDMLRALADVLHAVGVPATANMDSLPGPMLSPTNGKIYQSNGSGCIAVNAYHAPLICKYSRKPSNRCGRQSQSLAWQECYMRRVTAVTECQLDEPVYNLEVEEVHHYFANEFVVHNCNKDPAKSYGYIKLSSFNERMKRIELVAILNGTKEAAARNGGLVADDELEKLAGGDDLSISMACRIPFDICSSCQNKARSRAEYCAGIDEGGLCKAGGLRNKIATVVDDDDNPILHADNPDPLFFDMSKVPRGADRTAFTTGLLKAASGGVLLGGARTAEELGVTAPHDLGATGAAAEMMKLARKLADFEEDLERAPNDRWRLAFSEAPSDWSSQGARLGDVLQALARVKVAMPLAGFLELVGRDPVKVAAAAMAAKPHLRGVFGRLVKSGEAVPLVENNPFVPATALAPLAVRRWAEKKAADFSLARREADLRVLRAAVQGKKPQTKAASTFVSSGPAAELAKSYASYKLAFAHAVAQSGDPDLDLTLKLCVVQNYV